MYARGIINDMKRMDESGRSMHEIPKYKADFKEGLRH